MDDEQFRIRARRLRDLAEPIGANVYFAPEAHAAYEAAGLIPPPRVPGQGRAPLAPSYFASRGACLGHPPGEVVAAAFGVFEPGFVAESVRQAWAVTDPATLLAARELGAVASLERILDPDSDRLGQIARATALLRSALDAAPAGEGRALYSGLRSLGFPGSPLGDLWRVCDLLREHRGDSHIIAWVSFGLSPVEASISTELWWRLPLREYTRTRGWSEEAIDAAIDRFRGDGFMHGDEYTPAGEAMRAEIERITDRQERSILSALGDDADELFELLAPLTGSIVAAKGYPGDPADRTRYDQ